MASTRVRPAHVCGSTILSRRPSRRRINRQLLRSSIVTTVEMLENRQLLSVNPIGINFADGTGTTGIGTNSYNLAPTDTAGVVPISNWNNEHSTAGGNGAIGSATALIDSTNTPTTVNLQWQGNGTWDALLQEAMTDQFTSPGDKNLMAGYLDNFGGTAASSSAALTTGNLDGNGVLLTGVPVGLYDVYVYSMGAATGRGTQIFGTGTGSNSGSSFTNGPFSTYVPDTAPTTSGNNYTLFHAMQPTDNGSLLITVNPNVGGTLRGPINGIELVPLPADTSAPAAPTNLVATPHAPVGGAVILTWDDNADNEVGYQIERASSATGPWTQIASVPAVSSGQGTYTDTNVNPSTTYFYRVRAFNNFNGVGESDYSNTANATTGNFGLTARFFGQQFWQGPVLATQTLGTVNQNHTPGDSPVPGTVPDQNYSSVFTGQVHTDLAGIYTFISNTDDDGYLYVNGQLVSSDPGGHGQRDPATTLISPIQLDANTAYDIVFLQNQGGGGSGFHLLWKEPIPDPNNPGSTITGPETIVTGDHLTPTSSALPTISSVSATSPGNTVSVLWSISGTDTTSAYYRIDRVVVDSNGNPINGSQPVTIAKVRSVANGSSTEGAQAFNDNSVSPGQNYEYFVTAVGFDGTAGPTSSASNVVSVSTANQTTGVEERDYANQWWYSNGDPHNIEIIQPADHVATDGNIDARWNQTVNNVVQPVSPDASIPATLWSNIYTGKILTDQAGVYTFISNTDDDGYLFLNDGTSSSYKLVSQDPGGHGERNASTLIPVTLAASTTYNFIFLHSQNTGGAAAHMEWVEPSFTGTAQGPGTGTDTLVVSTATAAGPTGFVNGTITITGGTGKGQAGIITSYDPSTGTVFVNVTTGGKAGAATGTFDWTTPPDATSTYTIVGIVPSAGSTNPGATGGLLQVMDTPDAPTALTNPAGQLDPNFVGLTWTDNAKSEVNYVIERATTSDFTTNDKIVGTIGFDTSSFVDGSVQAGQTYFYRVYAKNFDSQSAPSATISVTVPATAVQTPGAEQHLYNNQFWNGNNGDPLAINQSGSPTAASWVANIDRNYGNFSPDPRIRITSNSQVFTGKVLTDQAGVYTFVTNNDDEGFLFLSNATSGWQLVSSDPGGHGQQDASQSRAQDYLVPVTLAANTAYNFVFFAEQGTGGQGAHLRWTEPNFSGTAQGAGTGANTIVLATSTTATSNAFVNGTITITGGTGKGQAGTITAYDPTTGTATVNVTTNGGTGGVWKTKPDATSTYTIVAPIPAAGTTVGGGGLEAIQDTPAAPATLAATAGSTAVQLTWSEPASGSELTWVVERATQADFSDAAVIGTTGMTLDKFTDTTAAAGQTYFYRVHGINFDGSGTAATVTATTIAAASGGTVAASASPITSATNDLTNIGTLDWAHWATNNPGEFDHKAAGGSQISDVTVLGVPTELQSPPLRNSQGGYPGAQWTDNGLLDRTNTGNGNAVMVHDLGDGFELTVPADSTTRVLRLWVGVTNGTGTVTARLSDGSAVATQTISNTGNAAAAQTTRQIVTINYSAPASSGTQFLIVDYKLTTDNGAGNVALSSATLGSPTDFPAPGLLTGVSRLSGNVELSWGDNTLPPNEETGFTLQQSNDNGATWNTIQTLAPDTTGAFINGLTPGSSYQFRVQAFNGTTTSAFSNVLTITASSTAQVFDLVDPLDASLTPQNAQGIDTNIWNITTRGLEHNAASGYNAPAETSSTFLTLGGSDTNSANNFWPGSSLETKPLISSRYTASVQVERVSSTGTGTGWRASLWLFQDTTHYLHWAQDFGSTENNNWRYNAANGAAATGGGTAIAQFNTASLAADPGDHIMKMVYTPLGGTNATIQLFLDNIAGPVINFTTWDNSVPFSAILTGQARASGDTVTSVFRNFNAHSDAPKPVIANNTIGGTAGNDTITIKKDTANSGLDDIWINVPTTGAPTQQADNTKTIVINGGGGTDTLTVDSSNGQPIPTGATGLQLNQPAGGVFTLGGTVPTLDATHTVDVTNATVNIPYTGTSILPAVQALLQNHSVFSSTAAGSSGKFAIADTDTGSQIALNYRVVGDLSGDGTVGFADLLALAQHYNNTGVDWSKGDLNYDGSVNFSDLLALAQHYNQTASAAPAAAASSTLAADTLTNVLRKKFRR